MPLDTRSTARDPRLGLAPQDLDAASVRAAPRIQRASGSGGATLAIGIAGALALGAFTLTSLSEAREKKTLFPAANLAPPSAPAEETASAATPMAPAPSTSAAAAATDGPPPGDSSLAIPAEAIQSRAMPMIIDNTVRPVVEIAAGPKAGAPGEAVGLSGEELFAARASSDTPPVVRAVNIGDQSAMIVQGTVIPAVLETAVNSDLPGFARAIVSADVRSFDGSRILVPRGSRLIGQYKSAVSTGQTRAFVIWSRLIRPDGISIQLGSPAVDQSGAAGLSGSVDTHFWDRFGSSILLSVVSGLAGSLGGDSSTVVIGTASDAQSAASIALQTDGKIPPTIKVPQGTPIQVFTAKDLDFSGT